MKNPVFVAVIIAMLLVAACGGGGHHGGGETGGSNPPTFKILGNLSGLNGTLVLQNNGADDLTLNADGTFSFSTALAVGKTYSVTIKTQPAAQSCTIMNATGMVASADVTNVSITCATVSAVTANFSAQATIAVGVPLLFDASASTSTTNSALAYTWDFGDGVHGGAVKLSRVYAKAGNYTITLTVADATGNKASKTQAITVTSAATGPAVNMSMLIAGIDEKPIAGVTASVVNGTASSVSDANGLVTLSVATEASVLIKLVKSGFADQFVPINFPKGTGADAYFQTHMLVRENALTLPDVAQGGTINGKDGAKITLSSNSLLDANGNAVTGAIQVSMTPVNVTTNAINGFPGRFNGVSTDTVSTAIVSYDSVEFTLIQNGQRLQLAPGKTATMEIPSYPNVSLNGSTLSAGASVPLWSLDENSGLWIQEGTGMVVASTNSPTGYALQATVGHFSWWNMDEPTDDSYNPKPKCKDGTIGVPGDTDHLADETICNMQAQFGGGGASGLTKKQLLAAAVNPIKPGYNNIYTVPMNGSAAIKLPANQALTLSAYAKNGTWTGHINVTGTPGDNSALSIPLYPVTSSPTDEVITLPFDATRLLAAGKSSRLRFNTDGSKPVSVVFAEGASSSFTGRISLLQGTTVLATNSSFSNLSQVLSSTLLPAGDYIIQIDNTGNAAATFSLQAQYIHWATVTQALTGMDEVDQMAFMYDSQGRIVIMDEEDYTPPGAQQQSERLVFKRWDGNAWQSIADTIELGTRNTIRGRTQISFALDKNDAPAYIHVNADGKAYSVHNWSGGAWQDLGANSGQLVPTPVGNVVFFGTPPIIKFGSDNLPVVMFAADSSHLNVQKFDGSNWVGFGPNNGAIDLHNMGVTDFSMTLDASNMPWIVVHQDQGTSWSSPFVVRYIDTANPVWQSVGTSLPKPTSGTDYIYGFKAPIAMFDPQGNLVIAAGIEGSRTLSGGTAETISGVTIYRFSGGQWTVAAVHNASASGDGSVAQSNYLSSQCATMNSSGAINWVWQESPALGSTSNYYYQTWDGATWQGLGSANGLVDNPAAAHNLDMQLRLCLDSQGHQSIAYVQDRTPVSSLFIGISTYVP